MSATGSLTPVAGSFDNAGDWDVITQPITRASGLPMPVSPDALLSWVTSAVTLVSEARASGSMDLLRGTFAAPVVAQCRLNADGLLGGRAQSVEVHLAAARILDGHGMVRLHLAIHSTRPDGSAAVDRQFWDLQLSGETAVAQSSCPNCGAPAAGGALVCGHCGTDLRSVVDVPLLVTRLELY